MEKKILEEILRIRLLSGYDMKSTLTENRHIILERGIFSTVGKSADDIAKLEKSMADALEAGSKAKKLTITSTLGETLRTTDEWMAALRSGTLSPAESAKVYWKAFKNTSDPKLMKAVSEQTVEGLTFSKKYGSLDYKNFTSRIKQDFNLADDQVEALWKANKEKYLKSLNKVDDASKLGAKTTDDVVDAGKGGVNQSQSVVVNNYVGGFKDADDLARRIGPDVDDIARQNKFKDANDWFKRDPEGMYSYARNNGKSGKGVFGRIIDWGKRRITWRTLKTLAILTGVGYGVWWLFFKEDGFKVECEPGHHFEEGKGCIPDGGGGEGGGEGGGGGGGSDNKPNTEVGPEGEKLKDPEGNKYEICEPPYYKGCVNKKGNTDIKKVQDCLGVTPNGFFNQETEDALKLKINKKSFSPSDINTICATSYGGASFRI